MNLPSHDEMERSAERVILRLALPPELAAFAGHFPDRPVLPGVVQLDWAVRFSALYFATGMAAARDFQVKFRKLIPPGGMTLTLRQDADARRLSFTYAQEDVIFSSGTIKLETP